MQVVDDDQKDAAGGVVPRSGGGQDDPFLRRRRRWSLQIVDAPAMHQRERRNLLLDAVFEDLELVLGQVSDELIAAVAHDRIHRDEVDTGSKVWLPGLSRGHRGCRRWRRLWG